MSIETIFGAQICKFFLLFQMIENPTEKLNAFWGICVKLIAMIEDRHINHDKLPSKSPKFLSAQMSLYIKLLFIKNILDLYKVSFPEMTLRIQLCHLRSIERKFVKHVLKLLFYDQNSYFMDNCYLIPPRLLVMMMSIFESNIFFTKSVKRYIKILAILNQ